MLTIGEKIEKTTEEEISNLQVALKADDNGDITIFLRDASGNAIEQGALLYIRQSSDGRVRALTYLSCNERFVKGGESSKGEIEIT